MKKYLFISAALALAGCSSDDFLGGAFSAQSGGNGEIVFNAQNGKMTRASESLGKDAATKLGNQFLVYGWKSDDGVTNKEEVFKNYLITYNANTAYTTEDNTHDWSYVGNLSQPLDLSEAVSQSIKYWDYSKNQYDFLAWDIVPGSTATLFDMPNSLSEAGYKAHGLTFKAPTADELSRVYIADQVTVTKSTHQAGNPAIDGTDKDVYGGYVTFKFRNAAAKVRVGLYETVPGYSISGVKFYANGSTPASNDNSYLFATTDNSIPDADGTIYVKYGNGSNDATSIPTVNNQAVTSVTATGKVSNKSFNDLDYNGANEYKESGSWLGRASNAATYGKGWYDDAEAIANNYYTYVFPMGATELNLKCDYTLTSIDGSGETVKVTGASAIVPAKYCEWKSNYAYTYLFKISDNTNGSTGTPTTDPAGLYPITFDAVVVDAIEGNVQETISELAKATITTYEFGTVVTKNDEYMVGKGNDGSTPAEIYVTASNMDANGNPAADLATLSKSAAAANTYKAELFLVNNLGKEPTTEETVQNYLNNSILLTDISDELKLTSEMLAVQTADNVKKVFGTDQLAYFRPVAGQTYAVRMTDNSSPAKVVYKVIKVVEGATPVTHTYTYTANSGGMDVNEGETLPEAITITENYSGADDPADYNVIGAKSLLSAENIKFKDCSTLTTPRTAAPGKYDAVVAVASTAGNKAISFNKTVLVPAINVVVNAFDFDETIYTLTPGGASVNATLKAKSTGTAAAYASAADAKFSLDPTTGSTGVSKGTAASGVVALTAESTAKGEYLLSYKSSSSEAVAVARVKISDWSLSPDKMYVNYSTDANFLTTSAVTLKLAGTATDANTSTKPTATNANVSDVASGSIYTVTPTAASDVTVSYNNATPVKLTATNFSMAFYTTTACTTTASAFTAGETYYVQFKNGASPEYVSTLSATNATITQTATKGVYKIIVASDYDSSNDAKKVTIRLNYKGIPNYITLTK